MDKHNLWTYAAFILVFCLSTQAAFADDLLWAVGEKKTVLFSDDCGTSWDTIYDSIYGHFYSAWFVNESDGYTAGMAVSSPARVYETDDGGYSWSTATSGYSLSSLFFVSENTGWVVGSGSSPQSGLIAKRQWVFPDWTWVAQIAPSTVDGLTDVYFSSSSVGYAVGSRDGNGVVIKTTNGGSTWFTDFYDGEIDNLSAISGDWAVGLNGVMLNRSGLFGWQVASTVSSENLNDVFFISESEGWVVGCNGAIFHTRNSGSSWVDQSISTGTDFSTVTFMSGSTGWVAGEDGKLYKTINGGADWSLCSTNSTRDIHEIFYLCTDNDGENDILESEVICEPSACTMSVSPQPMRSTGAINISLTAAQNLEIRILDISGRVVRVISSGKWDEGSYSIAFDGLSESGEELREGVYYCTASSSGMTSSQSFVILR